MSFVIVNKAFVAYFANIIFQKHFIMSVRDKLVELDLFFKSCLDRIPSDAYFSQATSYTDLDDSISVSQKKALKKRQKLNPKLMMKTSEMLETIEEEDDDDEDDTPATNKQWQVEQLKPEQSASLQELQQKLKTKLDEIKAKRGSTKRTPEEQLAIQKKRKLERARYKAKKRQKVGALFTFSHFYLIFFF